MQLTRELIGTEKQEMQLFFERFEIALIEGMLDGSVPTSWDAWEALGRMLRGLPLTLYKFMRMDYDNRDMSLIQEKPLYDEYRKLMWNGTAVYRQETRTEGRSVPSVDGASGYTAVLKYNHMGEDRPADRLHQTVGGPRARRPAARLESQLVQMIRAVARDVRPHRGGRRRERAFASNHPGHRERVRRGARPLEGLGVAMAWRHGGGRAHVRSAWPG